MVMLKGNVLHYLGKSGLRCFLGKIGYKLVNINEISKQDLLG